MKGRARLSLGLALTLVGLGMASFMLLGKSTTPPTIAKPSSDPPIAEPERRRGAVDIAIQPAPAPTPKPATKLKLDREASDRMRAQIQRSLEQHGGSVAPRSADPAGAREDEAPSDPPELDADYIRERIQEDLVPVAIECYESALADEPELAGTLVMSFAIIGDPEVGGVVDEATIAADQSTLDNEFVRECIRESMMAVSFEAPPDGGRVLVTYPIRFAPDEDGG
jgi:hypothetical protein